MKTLKTILGIAGLAASLGVVGSLSTPADSGAFALLGHSLGNGQRDFRVFNNFADPQSNNNQTPDPLFPSAQGAVQAIWKGHIEWGSEPWAGTGDGDPTQNILGNSGANFDNTFQGEASSTGGITSNIHSALGGSSGGTLAFMQGGGSGWWIRYYEGWTWADGPNSVSGNIDLQGVACHEVGHALGLNHSNVSGATMLPSITGSGTPQRSINNDDRAGLQAIYGTKSATKPTITGISGSTSIGGTLTITGTNFSSSDNDVWFTDDNSNGTAAKVTNVAATNGGTILTVSVPAGVIDGNLNVRSFDGSGGAFLSNAWPIDIGGGTGPNITSVDPALGPAGGWTEVTISGSGFTGATAVRFGGVNANSFTVDSPTQITAVTPEGAVFSTVDVEVQTTGGLVTLLNGYQYTFNPAPNITNISPNSGSDAGGDTVTITGGSVVGVTNVTFDGVAGTNLTITSATSLEVDTPPGSGLVDVTASGSGSSTITDGFTYIGGPAGAFVNIGPGIGGSLGVPSLTGTGDLTPGSATGYSTTVSGTSPFNLGYLFLSLTQGAVPFKQGTFYPIPILGQINIPMDISGGLTIPATIPTGQGFEGQSITIQWWFNDATAPAGAAGSNGLRLDVP